MATTLKCPNCGVMLGTEQVVGKTLNCPACNVMFLIDRKMLASPAGGTAAIYKLLIPLGYVAFVLVPLGLTFYFVMRSADKKAPEQEARNNHQAEADAATKPPDSTDVRRPPRRTPGFNPWRTGEKAASKPPEEPDARPGEPLPDKTPITVKEPVEVEVATAPVPRTVIEFEIAPQPRELVWKLPLSGFTSEWKKVGAVEIRISGLSVSKAPLLDPRENIIESEQPYLVVVVEVRKVDSKRERALLSWTEYSVHYASIFLADNKQLAPAVLKPGWKLRSGIPFKQILPEDGSHVRDVILFQPPRDDAGDLNLRLEGERCGEPGDIWFKIPSQAWKARK
jgi:hypothetical protein